MIKFYRYKQDYLKFTGNDRLDLIHRLSTNHVKDLQENKLISTILVTDKGRFVDLITLYNFGDFVFSTCSFNNSQTVISHLNKYTIMDDFEVQNMPGTHQSLLIFEDEAEGFIQSMTSLNIKETEEDKFYIFRINESDCIIHKNEKEQGGWIIIYPTELSEFIDKNFLLSLTEINEKEYDRYRIEKGIPVINKEMTDFTNPLECGLSKYVSFTKGCYIGQEVIARLDTYDKISKHLIGYETSEEVNISDKSGESKIVFENNEVGFVTSWIKDDDNNIKGLGFIKTNYLDYTKQYYIKDITTKELKNIKIINLIKKTTE
jgi:tRNA-modifying protein YgfZ